MMSRLKKMRRLGPLGASLAATAVTAAGFAAISVAQDGGSSGKDEGAVERAPGPMVFEHRVGPPPHISAEDREAMESFRSCMEENGADLPQPPAPGEFGRDEMPAPPKPPTESEREAIEGALEACRDELPEGAHFGISPCGSDQDSVGEAEGAREDEAA